MAAPMPDEWFASKIIGEQVYDSAASNAHSLGKITDLIPANDGSVRGVVIGVGGFLGMGEKNVAVDYGNLKWMQNANNTQVAVLATTKESLQAAPTFDTSKWNSSANAMNTAAPDAMNTSATVAQKSNLPLKPVDIKTVSASNLTGTSVYSADNKDIGEVGDVLLNKNGKIAAVVLDVGGFLGIGEKPVAIAFKDLKIVADANRNLYLHTGFTKAQLESAPTYDKNTYASNPDAVLLQSRG